MIEIHFLSQDSEDAEMESPKKNLELPLRIETDQKECGQIEEKAVEGFQSKEYERIFPHAAVCGPYGAEKTGSVIDAPLFGVCARIEIPVWDFYSKICDALAQILIEKCAIEHIFQSVHS